MAQLVLNRDYFPITGKCPSGVVIGDKQFDVGSDYYIVGRVLVDTRTPHQLKAAKVAKTLKEAFATSCFFHSERTGKNGACMPVYEQDTGARIEIVFFGNGLDFLKGEVAKYDPQAAFVHGRDKALVENKVDESDIPRKGDLVALHGSFQLRDWNDSTKYGAIRVPQLKIISADGVMILKKVGQVF